MGMLDTVKDFFDKRSEEREIQRQMQREIELERLKVFKDEYKKHAMEVAKEQAKRDAIQRSGVARMRAMHRQITLEGDQPKPGSFFEKLRDYTQANLARREENLKRTEMMRQQAEQNKKEQQTQRYTDRLNNISRSKAFGQSRWRQ